MVLPHIHNVLLSTRPPLTGLQSCWYQWNIFHCAVIELLGHGHEGMAKHAAIIISPTFRNPPPPPSYTHSTTFKSLLLHLLWYKKLIVVCCLLIVYWSSGSQLTIPLQTASPSCPCMGIVDEFGGQSYRLYCSMVGCWGKDWCHVGTWGTQLDGAIAVRTTLGGENSILLY